MILNKFKTLIVIINKADLIKDEIKTRTKYFNYYFENLFSDILIKPHFFSSIMEKSPDVILQCLKKMKVSKIMISNRTKSKAESRIIPIELHKREILDQKLNF